MSATATASTDHAHCIGHTVPWNASWSSELRVEIRPCRYAGGQLAVWAPHTPGQGRPLFAEPHSVRQRKSVAEYRCTVCGEKTVPGNRYWFGHVADEMVNGMIVTQEAPVHADCARRALQLCPNIKERGLRIMEWEEPDRILSVLVGGPKFEADFGIWTNGRDVIGPLKFAWWPGTMRRARARFL